MARYKQYSYEQGIMIPVDFTKQIVPGTQKVQAGCYRCVGTFSVPVTEGCTADRPAGV